MQTNYRAPVVPPRNVGIPIATAREGTRAAFVPPTQFKMPSNDFREDTAYQQGRAQREREQSQKDSQRVAEEEFEAKERRRAETLQRADLAKQGAHAKAAEEDEKLKKKQRDAKANERRIRDTATKLKSSQSSTVSTPGFYGASGSTAKQSSSNYPNLESRTGMVKKSTTYSSSKKREVVDISTPDSSPDKKRKPSATDTNPNKKSKKVYELSDDDSPHKPKPPHKPEPAILKSPSRSASPPSADFASHFEAKRNAAEAKERKEARAEQKRIREAQETRKTESRKKYVLDSDAESLGTEDFADELELALRDQEELVKNGGEIDRILQRDMLAPDPSVPLCPFCSAPLPLNPSARLLQAKAVLLARPTIQRAPTMTNPGGMKLPIMETAGFCSLHAAETTIIPEGVARGWPTEIDFVALAKQIKAEGIVERLIGIITRQTESGFYTAAVDQLAAQGTRRAVNVLAQMETFDVEQPGYYGPQGYEHLMKALERHFVETCRLLTTSSASPLSVQDYLRKVLLPEAAISLIAQDQKCTREEAAEIRKVSAGFGVAVFGMSKDEEVYLAAEAKREEKEKLAKKLKGELGEQGRSQEKEKKEGERKKRKEGERKQQDMMKEFTAKPKPALRKPKKALALQS